MKKIFFFSNISSIYAESCFAYLYYYIYTIMYTTCMYNEVNLDSSSTDISKVNVKFFMLCYTDYTILTDIKSLVLLIFIISFDL